VKTKAQGEGVEVSLPLLLPRRHHLLHHPVGLVPQKHDWTDRIADLPIQTSTSFSVQLKDPEIIMEQ
jgi:hypothetical protein